MQHDLPPDLIGYASLTDLINDLGRVNQNNDERHERKIKESAMESKNAGVLRNVDMVSVTIQAQEFRTEICLTLSEIVEAQARFGSIDKFREKVSEAATRIIQNIGERKANEKGFSALLKENARRTTGKEDVSERDFEEEVAKFLRVQARHVLRKSNSEQEETGELKFGFNEYKTWIQELGFGMDTHLSEEEFYKKDAFGNSPMKRFIHIQKHKFCINLRIELADAGYFSRTFDIIGFNPECKLILDKVKDPVDPLSYRVHNPRSGNKNRFETERSQNRMGLERPKNPKPKKGTKKEGVLEKAPRIHSTRRIEISPTYEKYLVWLEGLKIEHPVKNFGKKDRFGSSPEERFLEIEKKKFNVGNLVLDRDGHVWEIKQLTTACMIMLKGSGKPHNPLHYTKANGE